MSDLWVSWDEYHRMIERLAVAVHDSGWRFDSLLCLARGGLRIGDVISRVYDIPLGILAASSYREAAGRAQGDLDIAEFITMTGEGLRGRVLLVDDLVDSGVTLTRVVELVKQRFGAPAGAVTEVRTAVLWYKACSTIAPDYYIAHLADSPWIHQPFEAYDALGPGQLAARLRQGGSDGQGGGSA